MEFLLMEVYSRLRWMMQAFHSVVGSGCVFSLLIYRYEMRKSLYESMMRFRHWITK